MKKLFILLLVLCLLSGCSSKGESSNKNTHDLSEPTSTVEIGTNTTPFTTPENEFIAVVTPTVTPTQAPNVTQSPFDKNNFKTLYVIGSDVNVRSTPSTNGEILYQMPLNQIVKTFYKQDKWYYIEYRENHYGYMHENYLSETPSPERTPLPKRDTMLIYKNLPQMPNDADYGGGTYEMMNAFKHDITVCKEKISQITVKINEKDSKIGTMVDSLLIKWNEFLPSSTTTYHDLVLEFEPSQGTMFGLTRLSAVLNDYKELLDFLENIYLMIIDYEGYFDLNAEKASGSIEMYKNEVIKINGNIERLASETVREALQNANGYAEPSQKIINWYNIWNEKLYDFMELKWQILVELNFNKNLKSFEFYKAYDQYEMYGSYNYKFNDIILIMRGESTFSKE